MQSKTVRFMCLEANPRASRTVPLVSKVCNIRMVRLQLTSSPLADRTSVTSSNVKGRRFLYYGVKGSCIPIQHVPRVDPLLGPEMRSAGEVLGLSTYWRSILQSTGSYQTSLPLSGTVLISVNRKDKDEVVEIGKLFHECGI